MIETADIQVQLQEKWQIFWWSLGIGFLALTVAWRQGIFKIVQASQFPVIHGKDVLKGFGLFLFIELLLIPSLVSLLLPFIGTKMDGSIFIDQQTKGWINLFIILGGFSGVLIVYFQLTQSQRSQIWNHQSNHWYYNLFVGMAVWFVIYPLVLAFSQLISIAVWHLYHHYSVEQVAVQHMRKVFENPLLFTLTSLSVITIVPFTEEFLFRGLLQSWLKNKFHRITPAILISSLIFTIFHYSNSQGITNIELLSSLFILSCMLGYIFERQGSLWASIGLHSFFNFISLLMIFKEP